LRQRNRAKLSAPEEADATQIRVVEGSPGTTTPFRGSAHGQGDGPSHQKRLPSRGSHRGLSSNLVHLADGQTGYAAQKGEKSACLLTFDSPVAQEEPQLKSCSV